MTNPEEDAIIIREHARLRERIMKLTTFGYGSILLKRSEVLSLLHSVEADKRLPPIRLND